MELWPFNRGGKSQLLMESALLRIRPGEMLAIILPEGIPGEQLDYIAEYVEQGLPDGATAIVMSGDIKVKVVKWEDE